MHVSCKLAQVKEIAMNAKTIKMLPVEVTPGIHVHQGHVRVHVTDGSMQGNRYRLLNLHRPGAVRLSFARRITVEEWEKGR